jgi:uncharacterized membrane protein
LARFRDTYETEQMSDRVGRRSQFIDASRGLAMLLVFLSHFAITYLGVLTDPRPGRIASLLARPATPTFVLLSGLLIGFLSVERPDSFPTLIVKLVDRGLFLLIPAHAIIALAHLVMFGHARFIFITDAIGVSIMIGPWMVARFSSGSRALLGFALVAVTWRFHLTWNPSTAAGRWIHAALVGDDPFKYGWLTFPFLPWLGVYLLATPLGEALGKWKRSGNGFALRLTMISVASMGVGLALYLIGRRCDPEIRSLFSVNQKYPPSPPYVLCWGGLGLAVMTFFAWLEERRRASALLSALALLGRSSLVAFVVQYFVYYVVVSSLHLPASGAWPAYLCLSVLFIYGVAVLWERYLGNDYLTVGLPQLIQARHRAALSRQV